MKFFHSFFYWTNREKRVKELHIKIKDGNSVFRRLSKLSLHDFLVRVNIILSRWWELNNFVFNENLLRYSLTKLKNIRYALFLFSKEHEELVGIYASQLAPHRCIDLFVHMMELRLHSRYAWFYPFCYLFFAIILLPCLIENLD